MTKQRLDKLILSRDLAPSIEKARALIMAGHVVVGDHTVDKAGHQVAIDEAIRLRGEVLPYVSRGGLKLRRALDEFAVDVTGLVAVDVGSSTGGFTDCLLQAGAARVFAIDVGYGQLAWKLRQDARVVSIAPVNDLPLYVLLVRQALKGKVNKVADLKGRTIGVHSNSLSSKTNSHQLLDLVLAKSGVSPDEVRTVAVGQRWESESAMLAAGDADAVMGDEPYAARMEAEKIAFPLLHLGNPSVTKNIPGGGFLRASVIARTDLLERNPQKAELMVRIIKRTLDWLARNPPQTIVATAGLSYAPESKYLVEVLKKYPRQYSKDGKFSTAQLRETELFFHASQSSNPAARDLKIESMIDDRWSGRKN